MAREWSDCTERVRKAPCAWGASDPAALKVIGHVLEASQASGPGFGAGKVDLLFCIKCVFSGGMQPSEAVAWHLQEHGIT